MKRPALVVLAPIVPAATGNGLAMRIDNLVRAAAIEHDVHLCVVPVGGRHPQPFEPLPGVVAVQALTLAGPGDPAPLIRLLQQPVWRDRLAMLQPLPAEVALAPPSMADEILGALGPVEPSGVLACRLSLAPLGLAIAEQAQVPLLIDADDADAMYFADLGDHERAAQWDRVGALCVPRAQLVSTAGEMGRRWLAEHYDVGDRTVVIPNAVHIPDVSDCGVPPGQGRALFVGNLTYAPNVDGVRWFLREAMPRLPDSFSIDLVGNAHPHLLALARSNVRFHGWVEDVAPWYGLADVVIAPLRSGSGTRIKILEAFAHRRPVVTTTKGVEGIAAQDGTHVLVADSAEQWAAALIELQPGDRSAALIEAAWGLVSSTYNADRVRESTAQLFGRITGHGGLHA